MHMFLYLERGSLLLHFHANDNVQVFGPLACLLVPHSVRIELRRISILHIIARMMSICTNIDTSLRKILVKFIQDIVFALKINHGASLPFLVDKIQGRYICVSGNFCVIGTECRGNMHNASTILGSYIVAEDNTESLTLHLDKLVAAICRYKDSLGMGHCIRTHEGSRKIIKFFARLNPWHQLSIMISFQISTFHAVYHLKWYILVAMHIFRQFTTIRNLSFRLQIGIYQRLRHDEGHFLRRVRIISLYRYIINFRTHTKGRV